MNFYSRKLVKPADLNGQDTLFGGKLLEWLDEECAIFAHCQLDGQISVRRVAKHNVDLSKLSLPQLLNLRTKIIGEVDVWRKHERKWIDFEYVPQPCENGTYVWLPVICEKALDLREELGLKRNPFYPLHLTIGNTK